MHPISGMRGMRGMRGVVAVSTFATAVAASLGAHPQRRATSGAEWTKEERAMLRSLSITSLAPLAADPSNRVADDTNAARLGHRLFFDTRLSSNGKVACATCHIPQRDFQDGRPLGVGVGTAGRRTMPIAGTAHSPWQFWDGRADSQWGQALGPLESPAEHGGDRVQYAHVIAAEYREAYESVFGPLPDLRGLPDRAGPVPDTARARAWSRITPVRQQEISQLYANMGKAIAAYERKIELAPARFDRFVDAELAGRPHTAESAISDDERAGLHLFVGKANCATCHNGARFTDDHFHNTGVPQLASGAQHDSGRTSGARNVTASEFNCLSRYSDAKAEQCDELRFAVTEGPELVRAFKTPSLRNVAARAPYMHGGQFPSLGAALAHYDAAAPAPAGRSELKPLHLSPAELRQLEAFLHTLTGPISAPREFMTAPLDGGTSVARASSPRR